MGFVKFLNSKVWKGISLAVKIVAVLFAFLFTIITLAGSIMLENSTAINRTFHIETSRIEFGDSNEEGDTQYYKSGAETLRETRERGEEIVQEVMEEGAVLLKNDHGALPLKANAKVSLYSASSVAPIITGTGSSGTSNSLPNDNYYDVGGGVEVVNFDAAFTDAGFRLNTTLWNWYKNNYGTYGRQKSGDWGAYFSIRDAEWSKIPDNCKNFGGTAIFVVARRAGEGNDMGSYYGNDMVLNRWNRANDMTNGNYLALSPTELSVLRGLNAEKAAGKLDSIIVLINSANPVQCDFADDDTLGVDAVMWCGTLGQTGARGVANLMAGKDSDGNFLSPSGKLSDTFWKYHYKNPVNANFGKDMYHDKEWTEQVPMTWLKQEAANSSDAAMKANMITNSRSTVYAEGIYVGYRYTETRYEDYVNGRTDFNYYDTVSYPFGYGLSYTQFKYSNFKVTRTQRFGKMEDSVYNISVDVANVGTQKGKEAVQIYLQKPYTVYDKNTDIEKASVELVEFGKTGVLEPGGKPETVTFTVNERELACYDAKGAGTYILEEGDYYFTVGRDAHDAVNNIIKAKNSSASTEAQGITGSGDATLVSLQKVNKSDYETYSTSTKAMEKGTKSEPVKITNQFEAADILYYEGATEDFSYVTRLNWEDTVNYGFDANGNKTNKQVKVTVTDEMYQDRKAAMSDPEPTLGNDYPNYGINNGKGDPGHLNLIDLRAYADDDDDVTNDVRIAYNDPLWDKLLDQLTWEETTNLLKKGWRLTGAISSIVKPETVDFNGSVGFVRKYVGSKDLRPGLAASDSDPDKDKLMICFYPCNGVCASTFNKQLMEEYGVQWGEDSLWSGCSGLYGMGINLHRSPYGGRNFEYYSEDPYLMGKIASCTAKGCASKGLYVYLKHCVLNEQESYRIGGYCWLNEQTMREIYLKPFQIAIEDGYADCVMTAEPALGVKWSGQQGFVQTVLRDEFGMTGIAVSDYTRDIDGNYLQAFLAGSDLPDGEVNDMFNGISSTEGYGELAQAMRESTHRILYTVVHSNAMNGFSSNTRVYEITPAWITTLNAVKIAFTVLFVIFAVALVGVLATDTAGKVMATALKIEDVPEAEPAEKTPADDEQETSEQ